MVIRNDATIKTAGAYSDYRISIYMVTHPHFPSKGYMRYIFTANYGVETFTNKISQVSINSFTVFFSHHEFVNTV